jgi:integrase
VLNPISFIKRPKRGEPRNRVLNKYEIEKVLSDNTLDINFRSIILIALETGMRKSEILSIKKEHIDGDLLKIPVAKVRGRIIPLTKKAKSILLNSELPFKINKYTLGNKWRKLMKKHQIKGVCFHDLRHTALTNLFLNKSLSVPEVMLISGHSDPRILLRTYTNLKAQDLVEKIG